MNPLNLNRSKLLLTCFFGTFLWGCDSQAPGIVRLPKFSVTRENVGSVGREILEVENGLSLYFTHTNVVVWFGKKSDIVIAFDPTNLVPQNILFETPQIGEEPQRAVFDINADGVPDVRKSGDPPNTEVFFRGDWYPRKIEGTNVTVIFNERDTRLSFDGRRWIAVEPPPVD